MISALARAEAAWPANSTLGKGLRRQAEAAGSKPGVGPGGAWGGRQKGGGGRRSRGCGGSSLIG
jgi:hypothetical protein